MSPHQIHVLHFQKQVVSTVCAMRLFAKVSISVFEQTGIQAQLNQEVDYGYAARGEHAQWR
jgi:hypothetical protein